MWWRVYFRPRLFGVGIRLWLTPLHRRTWPLLFVFTATVTALIMGETHPEAIPNDSHNQAIPPWEGVTDFESIKYNRSDGLPHLWLQFLFKCYLSWKGRHRCWLWGSKQPAWRERPGERPVQGTVGASSQQVFRARATLRWPQGGNWEGRPDSGEATAQPAPHSCLWGPSRGPAHLWADSWPSKIVRSMSVVLSR